ncbi:MAG TPA: hypothetical protein VKA94_04085 [Hyphomicrobiales bacterium]|nr:hypothetical protein [Hyphomicrobiales bacterium]
MKTEKNLDWRLHGTMTYIACCYGAEGDEPGDVEVRLESAEDDDGVTWWRLHEPESGERSDEMWDDETEAREALESWCEDRDETPDADDIEAQIRETGYFNTPAIIPLVISEMTNHSQGYLLLTPDMRQPVGTRWTTNGYLQCDHISVDATHNNRAVAADSLLRAIQIDQESNEE